VSEGNELHLVWKADNGKQFQVIVARADAQTHKLIAIDGAIKHKDGTVESEDHTTFSSIAAFTVTPPQPQ
jgi:trehalose/maltose hydrolase-like predicted phosphorylase